MAKGGIQGAIGGFMVTAGIGAVASIAALWYFGFLKMPGATTAYARSRYGARGMNTTDTFGEMYPMGDAPPPTNGGGLPIRDPDYTKYMPDYENMKVSIKGEWDDYQLNNLENTIRLDGRPVAEADGYNPADPPISVRDQALSNW